MAPSLRGCQLLRATDTEPSPTVAACPWPSPTAPLPPSTQAPPEEGEGACPSLPNPTLLSQTLFEASAMCPSLPAPLPLPSPHAPGARCLASPSIPTLPDPSIQTAVEGDGRSAGANGRPCAVSGLANRAPSICHCIGPVKVAPACKAPLRTCKGRTRGPWADDMLVQRGWRDLWW